MRSARRRLLWPSAVVIGFVLGIAGYLVAPLPDGSFAWLTTPATSPAAEPSGTPLPTATASASPSPSPSLSPSPSPTPGAETGPPFTRAALLQPDEFLRFGWGKADRTSIVDGVDRQAPSLCAGPRTIGAQAQEAYTGEFDGLQTHAVEMVVRYASEQVAVDRFDRLSAAAEDCTDAPARRRSTPQTRHEPQLPAVEAATWWQVDVPAGAGAEDQAARGVVALARIDERLVYLVLTSPTSDPATTVQFEPLLTQAARRLV